MASIIISDETTRDVPEVSKMLDDRLKGKITMSCFLKFLNDNDIGIYYLAKSIDAIGKVDGLVFMPGWENSRGCKIEYQVAKEYGKFIREVK